MTSIDKMNPPPIQKRSDNESDPLLLSHPDLVALTGSKRVGAMIGWLKARGWVFEQSNKRGQAPCVSRLYFYQRMGVALNVTPHTTAPQTERQKPKLDFMKGKK